MIVLIHDLQRRLQQKEDEVASQEMLMKQLMEQQKAFQKRNKTLVGRLKAIKKRSNGHGHGIQIDEGFNNLNDTHSYYQQQQQQQHQLQIPETVIVEMKSLYDHYIRNPVIQSAELIHQIRIKSASIIDQRMNSYIVPRFNSLQINSATTILMIIEDILLQRLNAIKSENAKQRQIICLKEEYENDLNKIRNEKNIKERELKKIQNEIVKYMEQINEIEENQLFVNSNRDILLSDIRKLKKENERIAEEFLQGANVWNSEKAIMSAERCQIVNDLSFIAHNLEQLILERQQFENEANEFENLYKNIISVLREEGFNINIEYVLESNIKNKKELQSKTSIDIISKYRKQNTMKLKLYQQTINPSAEELKSYQLQPQIKINKKKMKKSNIPIQDSNPIPVIGDEADAYIPFDEPDAFNLLDKEYKKLAMKFVSETDNFISAQSIDAMMEAKGGVDVNLMAQEVLSHELQQKQEKLPDLQGWIEKKSPTFARGWQKRWVIVREYNIFYGKNKTDIKDTKNEIERKKFLNAIPLLVVQYIVATDHSRSGRKFEIVARDPRTGDRRHYQWRASNREECDKWVHGLNAHKKLLAARLQFLANTGQTSQ